MRKLFYFAAILFTINIVKAELPSIVALVNNEPITRYEFQARKHMIKVINNIKNLDSNQEKQFDQAVIKSLIHESLLSQYEKNIKISDNAINDVIENIDQSKKMPKNYSLQLFKSKLVDINSYKSQIKAELIKMNILSRLSRSVVVTPKEINSIIFASNLRDAAISAQIFTSKDKNDKTLQKMCNLQKNLKNCHDVEESIYVNFATLELIDTNFSQLDNVLQTIVTDLNIGQTSKVFETEEGFKLVSICDKKIININTDENNYVINALTNKKLAQKAQKFFEDIHKKAYIKVMLHL